MITTEQAAEYLDASLGITLPSFILQAAVDDVGALEPSLQAAGYTAASIVRIECMAVAIVAAAGDPRKIKSQGAPSGASRSFDNADQAMTKLRRALASLDTAGVTAMLVGADPSVGTLFFATDA